MMRRICALHENTNKTKKPNWNETSAPFDSLGAKDTIPEFSLKVRGGRQVRRALSGHEMMSVNLHVIAQISVTRLCL